MANDIVAYKPSVTLVNPDMLKHYLADVGRFSAICYADSRESINSMSDARLKNIGIHCVESGHFSGARHQHMIFSVSNVSRSATHQIVRHSVGVEINQRSQRYVSEDIPAYYIPASIATSPAACEAYTSEINRIWVTMKALHELGIPQEDTRELLPNATLSDMNIAISMQALAHLCEERLCTRVSFQFRSVVTQMRDLVLAEEPALASLLQCKCDKIGRCPESKGCGKY